MHLGHLKQATVGPAHNINTPLTYWSEGERGREERSVRQQWGNDEAIIAKRRLEWLGYLNVAHKEAHADGGGM